MVFGLEEELELRARGQLGSPAYMSGSTMPTGGVGSIGVGLGVLVDLDASDGGAADLQMLGSVYRGQDYLMRLLPRGVPAIALAPTATGTCVLPCMRVSSSRLSPIGARKHGLSNRLAHRRWRASLVMPASLRV
mgnify:CR=1 FL=1